MTPVRIALVLALVAVPVVPAVAAPPAASYSCRADTKFGQHHLSLKQTAEAKAPRNLRPNTKFTIAVFPKGGSLPGEVRGFKLQQVHDLALRVPVPPTTTFISARLLGGSGLGSTPTVRREGGVLVIRVPGPIAGGTSYQLPTLSVRLRSGGRGTFVETRLHGTSYDNPGLTLRAKIKWKFVTLDSPVNCFPDPNPTLTRTPVR